MKKKKERKTGAYPCVFACRIEVELLKENLYRGLVCGVDKMLEYSNAGIAFRLKNGKSIRFVGKGLFCNTMYSGASEVIGKISSVVFLGDTEND